MTIHGTSQSQRQAARVAGFTFLFALVIVVAANYAISFRLSVPGNAAETAGNILANEGLFRINVAGNLLYGAAIVVLLSALYVILRPVDRNLALAAAFCRLVVALMWCVTALNMLGTLRLLGGSAYLGVFEADRLQALARLRLDAGYDAYYIGLPFWTLASTVCSYLWFKSRYVPRPLAAAGMIASAWCAFCAFAFLISPGFQDMVHPTWYDMPMVIFETALGIWLLFKGVGPAGTAAPELTRPEPSGTGR